VDNDGTTQSCVAEGDCNTATVTCDGPEDCTQGAAAQCCVEGSGDGLEIECSNNCQGLRVCHPAADCEPPMAMCCDQGTFPSRVCAAQCGMPE